MTARKGQGAFMPSDEDIPLGPDVSLMPSGPIVAEQYARICAAQIGAGMAYVEAFGAWLVWDEPDGIWRVDNGAAMQSIGDFCLSAVASREKAKDKEKLGSLGFVFQLERRMRAMLAAQPADWDADPMLLNTPGPWTIELETGDRRPSRREDRCTKSTAVGPGGHCPLWLRFLDDICAGSPDRIAYLQRIAGYCATGRTSEQALFFLYGTGQNGKGTFIRTLAEVLKDYASVAAIETFSAGLSRHLEELAVLRGARLVHTSETEQGRGWNESRLKQIAGGDDIRANLMRQNSFSFRPSFKVIISGNHKPKLASTDKAIRRRLNLIPFDVEIPDERRDDELEDRLKLEASGILAWILEGTRQWQLTGLAPPVDVRNATDEYVTAEDLVGGWLDECCNLHPGGYTKSSVLFGDAVAGWKHYSESRGEHPGNLRGLSNELVRRGYKNYRRGFKGIELRSHAGAYSRTE